jgi:serine protease Do
MRHPTSSLGTATATALALLATSVHGAPPPPLPPPGQPSATPTPPAPPESPLQKGLALIERDGRPLAIGTILAKDGRVLTALSPLTGSDLADVRYADGSVAKVKVGHRDAAWDLALLVPQTGKWKDGLVASDADPTAIELKSATPLRGKVPALIPILLKMRTDAKTKEGETLGNVLDLDLKGSPAAAGTPILDPAGGVVALLGRACKQGDGPCVPVTIGVPVPVIRQFLMRTPASAVQPAPWLGLGVVPASVGNVKGVRVLGVMPQSPAEKAGLRAGESGDLIVAVDGKPIDTFEGLAEVIATKQIGQNVKLLVYGDGKFRDVSVILRTPPEK